MNIKIYKPLNNQAYLVGISLCPRLLSIDISTNFGGHFSYINIKYVLFRFVWYKIISQKNLLLLYLQEICINNMQKRNTRLNLCCSLKFFAYYIYYIFSKFACWFIFYAKYPILNCFQTQWANGFSSNVHLQFANTHSIWFCRFIVVL